MTKNTSCPICRGEIHAIAGRCKHCKADLVEHRERAARTARAQALGATVPPAPLTLGFAATNPRPATIPPGHPGVSPGPMSHLEGPAPSPHRGGDRHASTMVGSAGEVPPFAPENRLPHLPKAGPNGTPTYGLGFASPREHRLAQNAGRRMHRVSTWSRRWPFVVSAVALVAIGVSIGVLAERWRRGSETGAAGRVRQSNVTRRPVMVPDRMPRPLVPSRPSPPAVPDPAPQDRESAPPPHASSTPSPEPDPDSDPDGRGATHSQAAPEPNPSPGPDPSNPGSRFSQPPPDEPASDARAFRTFTTSLTESLCQKLTQCGIIDSATQSMCRAFGQELDPDDVADKVARGECSFNEKAARACLQAVSDLRCDPGSGDRMWDWLMAPNRASECAEAYVCQ